MTQWPDAYVHGLQEDNARLRAERKERIIADISAALDEPHVLDLVFALDPSLRSRLRTAMVMSESRRPKTQDEKVAFRKEWDARVDAAAAAKERDTDV